MHVGNHFSPGLPAAPSDGVEVVGLEPHGDSVAEREIGIGDAAMVVSHFERVKLEHHRAVDEHLLVPVTTMAAGSVHELLIPAAWALHVCDDDQRLRADRSGRA